MDYGTFRGLYTLLLLIIMIAIIVWAYSKRRKASFDEAANLVFADDRQPDEQPKANDKHAGAKQP